MLLIKPIYTANHVSRNLNKQSFECRPCKNKTKIAQIHIPYAAKLLFQELQAMNIAARMFTNRSTIMMIGRIVDCSLVSPRFLSNVGFVVPVAPYLRHLLPDNSAMESDGNLTDPLIPTDQAAEIPAPSLSLTCN